MYFSRQDNYSRLCSRIWNLSPWDYVNLKFNYDHKWNDDTSFKPGEDNVTDTNLCDEDTKNVYNYLTQQRTWEIIQTQQNDETWILPVFSISRADKESTMPKWQKAPDLYNIVSRINQFEFNFIMANKSLLNQNYVWKW